METKRTKCANNQNIFNSEYPTVEGIAFAVSGDRFFPHMYMVDPSAIPEQAWKEYVELPEKHEKRSIVMGVDVASGTQTGDFSAAVVLDCTNPHKPFIIGVYHARVHPSTLAVHLGKIAKRWNARVVVEANTYGLSVIKDLDAQHISLYRRRQEKKVNQDYTQEYGWYTGPQTRQVLMNRLYACVTNTNLEIPDHRLRKDMNGFVYGDTGKPEAQKGQHDDLVIALGLSVVGMDQAHVTEFNPPPPIRASTLDPSRSMEERLLYELDMGVVLEDPEDEDE